MLAFVLRPSLLGVIDMVGTLFGGLNGVFIALTAARVYTHQHCCQKNRHELVCLLIGLVYLTGIAHWIAKRVL